jgi:hypothetical protein
MPIHTGHNFILLLRIKYFDQVGLRVTDTDVPVHDDWSISKLFIIYYCAFFEWSVQSERSLLISRLCHSMSMFTLRPTFANPLSTLGDFLNKLNYMRFEVLMAMKKSVVCRFVTPFSLTGSYQHFMFRSKCKYSSPGDGGTIFLRIVGDILQYHRA